MACYYSVARILQCGDIMISAVISRLFLSPPKRLSSHLCLFVC